MAGDAQRARVLLCNGGADLSTLDYSVRSAALHTFAPLSLIGAAEKYGHLKVLRLLQAKEASVAKSPTASPVRETGNDGFAGNRSSAPSTSDDRLMAGPPTSAMCSIL
ncbi:hypothetical protein ElyMa_000144400 [Elysia marginata]|uniref:Uncharacterized protein n=1 Tax=Elysia marginata TaxID=1093978 RepID=A0AAV4ER29_9GAST|nr:hypothetical protein ElyMa_000144400 [Elysia marginata]